MEKYLSDAVVADFAGLVDCEANSKTIESYVAAFRLMFGVKLFEYVTPRSCVGQKTAEPSWTIQ